MRSAPIILIWSGVLRTDNLQTMLSRILFSFSSRIKKVLSPSQKERMKHFRYAVVSWFLRMLEFCTGRFITFHTRPMYADGVVLDAGEIAGDYSEYAIVMQGGLVTDYDFTLETLRLYKRYYPGASLILSTWEGEDNKMIEEVRSEGIEVLLNQKPEHTGPRNVNLQIVSATAGIRRAAETGRKYALKTRTDMRLYNHSALRFLRATLTHFPFREKGIRQKGRLVSIFGSVRKWYFAPDILVFGYTEDVRAYFDAPLVADTVSTLFLGVALAPFVPEQYFLTAFLKKVGYPLRYTHHDSLRVQAKHMVVLDQESLDWYWYKYDRHLEYRHLSYRRRKRIMGFPEWFTLYCSYDSAL